MRLLDALASPHPTRSKRWIGGFALVGLVASLAVHLSTFLDPSVAATMRPEIALPLHVGLFPPFAAALFALRPEFKDAPRRDLLRRLATSVPRWARVVFVVAFYYAFVNFAVFMVRTGGAHVTRRLDGPVLTEHGRVIRSITPEEATRHEILVARGFSGHWIIFYLVPTLVFLVRRGPPPAAEPRRSLVR